MARSIRRNDVSKNRRQKTPKKQGFLKLRGNSYQLAYRLLLEELSLWRRSPRVSFDLVELPVSSFVFIASRALLLASRMGRQMILGGSQLARWTLLASCLCFGWMSSFAVAQDAAAPAAAPAAETPAVESAAAAAPWVANSGDQAWVLASSALVLLMTPGLAFFYGGLVRRKNILSVLMQCFMCMCMVTILWVVVGFSLAFGPDVAGGFCGNPMEFFMLKGIAFNEAWEPVTGVQSTISEQTFMVFQSMFAIITPGLIIGALQNV